ncbi:hypothetical protein F2P56_004771 [Juglans regia]|uniref:Uncharacterized protein LOC108983874 n=2 Tax=Juglans regia TaxID=51240 RepID=A0A2I4DVM2_JUGRE|nr:uncharacterized protein LOC108983874 [Juglans regia]KAF5478189.1 hypothetical protein F2P56_004771 [Juglans regia]
MLLQNISVLLVNNISKVKELCCWKPPAVGSLKLNVDGAMFFDRHKAGIGAVLRDDKGDVVLAASKIEYEVNELEDIELLAMFGGIQICANMGIRRLILESARLLMVNEVNASEASFSLLGNLVREVKMLKALFEVCLVQHVDRAGNEVAHKLVRNAWNVENLDMWWENLPEFVIQAVWLDKNL